MPQPSFATLWRIVILLRRQKLQRTVQIQCGLIGNENCAYTKCTTVPTPDRKIVPSFSALLFCQPQRAPSVQRLRRNQQILASNKQFWTRLVPLTSASVEPSAELQLVKEQPMKLRPDCRSLPYTAPPLTVAEVRSNVQFLKVA